MEQIPYGGSEGHSTHVYPAVRSRPPRTNQKWKATRQWNDRKRYRAAGVVMEEVKKGDPFKRWGHWAVGISAQAGPVKVYGPDGTLREVVSASDWRKRFGDPFKNQSKEADDGEAERTPESRESEENPPR